MAGNPYWDKLVLGLHCDGTNGSTTFTEVKGNTVTANGNAQISTAQYPALTGKTSSGLLDGAGDYLSIPDSANWDFGTGDFTVRGRFRFTSHAALQLLIGNYQDTTVGWYLQRRNDTNTMRFAHGSTTMLDVSWTPTNNIWYDIELSRAGTSVRFFVDGTQVGSTATSSANVTGSSNPLLVGSVFAGSYLQFYDGFFSEVEIYKGLALHTANFTPTTDPFLEGYLPAGAALLSAIGNPPYFSYVTTSFPQLFVNS